MKKFLLLACVAGFSSATMGISLDYIFDVKMNQTALEQGKSRDKITQGQQDAVLLIDDLYYDSTGRIIFYSKGQITSCDATIIPENYDDSKRTGKISITVLVDDLGDVYDRTLMVFGLYQNDKSKSKEPERAVDPETSYISLPAVTLNNLSADGVGVTDVTATGVSCGMDVNLRFNKNLSTSDDSSVALTEYLSKKTGLSTEEVSSMLFK